MKALLAAAATSLALLAMAATPAPPARAGFAQASIDRGANLAAIGNCGACHTAGGGAPYAGGLPLATPFGKIYGSNITPDRGHGIGDWSAADFVRRCARASPPMAATSIRRSPTTTSPAAATTIWARSTRS